MPDYELASSTKDHYATELLKRYPQIVSISPRLALDSNGLATDEGNIVIGVRPIHPKRDLSGQPIISYHESLPSELIAVDSNGTFLSNVMVPVIYEVVDEISFQSNTAMVRPCPGGYSISHSASIETGTLGCVVRINGNWGYVLSNNHVLALNNNAAVGDGIFQPGQLDGGNNNDAIATLERWVPIIFGNDVPNEVDCAVARVLAPWEDFVERNVTSIGIPAGIGDARVGQEVRKSGRTTGLTNGTVLSTNASIRVVSGTALFTNQLELTPMSAGGDSGSLIFDRNSLTVLGLLFGMSNSTGNTYANKIATVIDHIKRPAILFNLDGSKTTFDQIEIELI